MRAALLPAAILGTTIHLSGQNPPAAEPAPASAPAPIDPVPLPEGLPALPDFDPSSFQQPKNFHVKASSLRVDAEKNVFLSGPIEATTDTKVRLTARSARLDQASGKYFLSGNIKIASPDGLEIFADNAVANPATSTVELSGDIAVYQGNLLQRGSSATYDWKSGKLLAQDLRASVDPLLLESGRFEYTEIDGKPAYVGHHAGVTTHDVEDPGFWLRADEIHVFPDDRVTFENLRVYAGDTPIFWLPYFTQPLNADLGYQLIPGARTSWGFFLLNSYGTLLGDDSGGKEPWLLSRWHFDLRSRRGLGTGVDLSDVRLKDNPNLTGLSLYYTNDLDPSISRNGLSRGFVNEDRYRLDLKHRVNLPWEPDAEWRVDANLSYLSDSFYLEDFEPDLFRRDPFPDNTVGLFRRDDASLFSIYSRLRLNEFYRSDTRAPEIALDMARRPILGTPILHEGTTSLSFIREEIGRESLNIARDILALPPGSPAIPGLLRQLPAYERQIVQQMLALPPGSPQFDALDTQLHHASYARFNTYQELSLQADLGPVRLTPEVGLGYSNYWNVDGPTKNFDQIHFHAGIEASMKFSRNYDHIVHRPLGVDGLLHVVQPYTRLSYLSTDDIDPFFPGVDRSTFATRPQSLSVPRLTTLDEIQNWSLLRMGVRNHLITRRDSRSFEWLSMDTYIDAFLDDPEIDRNYSNLYNDITWNPLPWFGLNLETQFPVVDDGSGFSEVAASARFMPNENLEFAIGQRFLDNHPVLLDSNRYDFRVYARLNDRWGVGAFQRWEFDDGTLEVQQYSLHRDFNHWVASVGITQRDNRLRDEFGVVFSFTLKDFPSASLPLKLDAQ